MGVSQVGQQVQERTKVAVDKAVDTMILKPLKIFRDGFNQVVECIRNPRLLLRTAVNWLTPGKNPLLWVIINLFVVFYSIYLLLLEFFYAADEGKKDLRNANESYIVYDFVTTIVWVVETSLGAITIIDEGGNHIWKFNFYTSILHFVVSIFFLWDTWSTLEKWKWTKEDIVVDAFWVALNLLAYVAVLVETLIHCILTWGKKRYEQNAANYANRVQFHDDPLLTSILPHYDSIQRKVEKRPERPLRWDDHTQVLEALRPEGINL